MENIVEMAKYRLHIWIQGHLYIMPLVALGLYDGFCFSIRPVQLVTCVVVLCFVLFITMVWTGYTLADRENPVEEQLLYLRVVRKSSYYVGKSLFLISVQFLFAILAILMPLILAVTAADTFSGTVTAGDLAQSFLLLLGSASAGMALGSLLSPRVMRDRKLSLLLTMLLAVLSVLGSTLKKYAVAGWFVWLLPPISAIGEAYGSGGAFLPGRTIVLWGMLVLHSMVCLLARDLISHKRRF